MDESHFDPGGPAREVALVLLEASALPRRLVGSPGWPSALEPRDWQVLLALALATATVDPEGAGTPRGIASALTIELEEAYDALHSLRGERLASIEFHFPDASEAEQEWSLTREGAAAAAEIVSFTGRVIRWPPAPPSSLT